MSTTSIEWTDITWNPVRGCSRVSEGCRNCYAERQASRFTLRGKQGPRGTVSFDKGPFYGFVSGGKWTGRVELIESKLAEPLSWRKPRRVFVNSMSDLFHESLSDEAIAAVFGVMAAAPQHTFQVLTKRPERMRKWFEWIERHTRAFGTVPIQAAVHYGQARTQHRALRNGALDQPWPLPNVWLGTSAEDQPSFDARSEHLLKTPAAVRFVSLEPLLGPIDLGEWDHECGDPPHGRCPVMWPDWVIVGGESGPGARPCDVAWIRSIVEQCRASRTAVFVKQAGARPTCDVDELDRWPLASRILVDDDRADTVEEIGLRDRKGGDPSEWPEDLRVREFPEVRCG